MADSWRGLLGAHVRKKFARPGEAAEWYTGKVVGRKPLPNGGVWWHVKYDDGQSDDNSEDDFELLPPPSPAQAKRKRPKAEHDTAAAPAAVSAGIAATPMPKRPRNAAKAASPADAATPQPSSPPPRSGRQARGGAVKATAAKKKKQTPQPGAPSSPAVHVAQLNVTALPTARGPACVNYSSALVAASPPANGVCALTLERFVRFVHYRACVGAGSPPPEDHIQACIAGGTAYRHVDAACILVGSQLRAQLAPLFAQQDGATEALSHALRAAVLRMVVGRPQTFVEWRAWHGNPHGCPLPTTDADLVSFEQMLRGPRVAGKKVFTTAYQTRGYGRIANLVSSLRRNSRKVAVLLRQDTSWEAAVKRVIKSFVEVGPFFGGQAMCFLYFGVAGSDSPGGPFRTGFFPHLDPASLLCYASPGKGPQKSLLAIFGENVRGKDHDKIAWLAANFSRLITWAGLEDDFQWLPASDGLDGAVLGGAPAGKRPLSAVDLENCLCFFHRAAGPRDTLRGSAQHLAAALRACGGVVIRVPALRLLAEHGHVAEKLRNVLAALRHDAALEVIVMDEEQPADDLPALAKAICVAAAALRAAGGDPAAVAIAALPSKQALPPQRGRAACDMEE